MRWLHMAVSSCQLARELEELIAALDRRLPRVGQAGEAAIAHEAASLRAKAVDRLAGFVNSCPVPACALPMQDA